MKTNIRTTAIAGLLVINIYFREVIFWHFQKSLTHQIDPKILFAKVYLVKSFTVICVFVIKVYPVDVFELKECLFKIIYCFLCTVKHKTFKL